MQTPRPRDTTLDAQMTGKLAESRLELHTQRKQAPATLPPLARGLTLLCDALLAAILVTILTLVICVAYSTHRAKRLTLSEVEVRKFLRALALLSPVLLLTMLVYRLFFFRRYN